MQTQLSEKLGQSGSVFQADQGYNPQVSTFDLSKKSSLTFSEGMKIPLDVIRCLPNDTHRLSYRWLLDVMPMVVPPQTNYKFIISAYWCALTDLWKGAETFVTKGRSANINMSIPVAKYWNPYKDDRTTLPHKSDGASSYSLTVPHGLPAYFGLNPLFISQSAIAEGYTKDAHSASYLPYANFLDSDNNAPTFTHIQYTGTGFNHLAGDGVNALIPFMYQKICRMDLPTNLLQDNKIWFPDDISNDDWRIAPDGSNLTPDGHFCPIGTTLPSDDNAISNFIPHVGAGTSSDPKENAINIWQLRYSQYGDDLATTAKPWLVRGAEQELNLDVTGATSTLFGKYVAPNVTPSAADAAAFGYNSIKDLLPYDGPMAPNPFTGVPFSISKGVSNTPTETTTIDVLGNGARLPGVNKRPGISLVKSANGNPGTYLWLDPTDVASRLGVNFSGAKVALTANTLRSLLAFSIKDEIDALTNGNYNATIRAHYGVTPKHHDFEPRYIGGTVEYLNFGSVMQTSASTSSQPLGSTAGTGSNSAGCDFGTFHCDDFGYIMVIGTVVPEVTYSTGIDRMWTDVEQEDLWYPEYSALGFQPVLNKELFVTGTDYIDNGLFGYQTRGIEYKQRRNDVRGLFALGPDKDAYFSAYNQARLFSSTPKLSNEFVTCSPQNLRRDYLAFPDLPSYRLQLACDVKSTRTLPYKSVPARFGM